ncbi:MAG: hypothetical protein ABR592_10435 [Nitriliruptorales bacterium]
MLVAAISVLLLPTQAACASCVRDDRPLSAKVAESEIAFVGTVITVSNAGRTARMQVEEIWRGSELGEQVVVHGGPEGRTATSVDRHWEASKRYLVFPRWDEGRLEDDACSPTAPWEPQLAAFRPDHAYPLEPRQHDSTAERLRALALISVAVIVLVLAIGWLVRRSI